MKHKGNVSEFIQERNSELYSEVVKVIQKNPELTLREACAVASLQPTKRHWVSEERAIQAIYSLKKNGAPTVGHDASTRRNDRLLTRVNELRKQNPELSIADATTIAVNEPAAEYYLSSSSAYNLFHRQRREMRYSKPTISE